MNRLLIRLIKYLIFPFIFTAQIEKDVKGEVVAREMANVRDLAQRFEITGTPFLIIGEEAFPGAIPAAKINEALDK